MKIIVAANIKKSIVASMEKHGFEVFYTPQNPRVLSGLSFHPDMQIAGSDGIIVCEKGLYDYYKKIFVSKDTRLLRGETELSCNYPGDIAYNVKVVGENVFHKSCHTDLILKNALNGKKIIDVPQGYSGCSICMVSDNAIITADKAIHKKAVENNIHSLIITPGHIKLVGFDYGFIGGASFFAEKSLYFFGDISSHPDFYAIENFCKSQEVKIIPLSDEPLTDYGGAITF